MADAQSPLPQRAALQAAYPNPFNAAIVLPFRLDRRADVRLMIYDILGRRVQVLLDETLPSGAHRARWNGTDGEGHSLASGVYLYRLFLDGAAVSTRKVMLLR